MVAVLVSLLLIPFVIYTAFLVLCTLRAIQARNVELPLGMSAIGELWFIVGIVADVLFNWTWGAWIFREWRGTTFSSHVQWRVDNGRWDQRTQMWVAFLNAGAPGHIKTPASFVQ